MEESLLKKMLNGTCDEIDEDMIQARLKFVHNQLFDVYKDIAEALHKLDTIKNGHEVEIGMLGVRLIVAIDDDLVHTEGKGLDGIPVVAVVGGKTVVKTLYESLSKVIDS